MVTVEQRGHTKGQRDQKAKRINVKDARIIQAVNLRQQAKKSKAMTSYNLGLAKV